MKLKLLLWCYFCFHLAIGHTQGTVTVSESTGTCFNNTVFTYHSTHATGRYNYRVFISGFGITLELGWSVTNSRWEIRNANNASAVFYTNTLTTSDPYPPANSWFNASCGTITRFDRSALPIELLTFNVQNTEGSKNNLTWRTESEKNNSHFDIERSTDGKTFHSIGQVKGNNKPSSYQFVDHQPFATSYYRLRQIDFDGTETLSKVVSVELKGKGKGLTVYPTLVSNGILTVDTEGGQLRDYSVMNLLGQQVLVGKTTTQIDVSSLAKGTYMLKVGTEVAKFVKQ